MPMSSRRRRERRERLRSGGAADGGGSLHRVLRSGRASGRGRNKGDADRVSESLSELFISDPEISRLSLRKRAHSQSHLRRRGGRKTVPVPERSPDTTSEEYPPWEGSTSEDVSPPVPIIAKPKPSKVEEAAKQSKSSSPVQVRRLDDCSDHKDGESCVAEYDQATEPFAPWSLVDEEVKSSPDVFGPTEPFAPWCNGTLVELECNVCERVGHLGSYCPYLFRYPDDNPHFDRDCYDIVCVCGDELLPGSRSCGYCPPNCGVKLSPKPEYLPLVDPDYENPDPDPIEFFKMSTAYRDNPDSLKEWLNL